jgi:hypothetical protein
MIIAQLVTLFADWRMVFAQARTHRLAVQMAFAVLCVLGRNTVSQRIVLLRRLHEDWTKFYRLFSKRSWEVHDLFAVVLQNVQQWCPGQYLVMAGDDTLTHKTGRLVHNVGYLRDPLSPKFRHNLVLGLRYIQLSVLVPLYRLFPDEAVSAVALPVRFALAPVIRKPKSRRKPMTAAEEEAFKQVKAANTLSHYMADHITELRKWMDTHGLQAKRLLLVVDNGYCNKIVLAAIKRGIHLLARMKKTSRLYLPGQEAGAGFTPEDTRKDAQIPWRKCPAYLGRTEMTIHYKEVAKVVWPTVTGKRVLRLIVIRATPYKRRKNANISYRQPGFLITTDLTASTQFLIQSYLDRWQIEVNHREEKTVIGVGQAQVRTEASVTREPAFAVAAYSMMKLAALQALGTGRPADCVELPAWYSGASRASCEDLLQKLRREACELPALLAPYGVSITPEGLIAATRA